MGRLREETIVDCSNSLSRQLASQATIEDGECGGSRLLCDAIFRGRRAALQSRPKRHLIYCERRRCVGHDLDASVPGWSISRLSECVS